jgi:hypothetical protein
MTTFPTQAHFFDSIWPLVSYGEDKRVFMPIQRHTDFESLEANVADNPVTQFLLLVEDFDAFNKNMPARWLRMPPEGGIPTNVWIGASINTQKEADKRLQRLMRLRARVRFAYLKKGHDKIDLSHALVAWRCSICGRAEGYGRLKRPDKCPTGTICADAHWLPQIHWVIDLDMQAAHQCEQFGVALWDGQSLQVPE